MNSLDLLQMATNAGGILEGPSSVRMRRDHLEHLAARLFRAAAAARAQLDPAPIDRNALGYFFHPALPQPCDESFRFEWFAAANGFDAKFVVMEDDELAGAARDRYLGGAGDFSGWTPKGPPGKGWFCLAIYDCEEGPTAVFVRAAQRPGSAA